jgi:hypothetical protein
MIKGRNMILNAIQNMNMVLVINFKLYIILGKLYLKTAFFGTAYFKPSQTRRK